MIFIYTGTPGAGKTMCLVADAVARGESEKRPVYFSGIPGLSGDGLFELLEPSEWMGCPDGSIVIIDEAQRVFPSRLAKVEVPASIRAMETHRHRGIDIYLATQSVSMLDIHLRRLGNVHKHLVRVFGLRASTVYEWDEVTEDTRDRHSRHLARKSRFKFSRKHFGRYKSSTIDTAQARFPLWLKVSIPLLVGVLVFIGVGLHREFSGMRHHFMGAHAVAGGHALPAGYHLVRSVPVVGPVTSGRGQERRAHGWRIGGTIAGARRSEVILLHHGNVQVISRSVCRGFGDFLRCRLPGGLGWVTM